MLVRGFTLVCLMGFLVTLGSFSFETWAQTAGVAVRAPTAVAPATSSASARQEPVRVVDFKQYYMAGATGNQQTGVNLISSAATVLTPTGVRSESTGVLVARLNYHEVEILIGSPSDLVNRYQDNITELIIIGISDPKFFPKNTIRF